MSSSARRSSRRSTVVSTLASGSASAAVTLDSDGDMDESRSESPPPPPSSSSSSKKTDENDCPLFMECDDDPMSSIQKEMHKKRAKEFSEQMLKLENLASRGARIAASKDNSAVIFRNTDTTASTPVPLANASNVQTTTSTTLSSASNSGFRLLMDPRTGRILSTINGSGPLPKNLPAGTSTLIRASGPPPPVQAPTMPQAPRLRMPATATMPPRMTLGAGPKSKTSAVIKPTTVVDLTRPVAQAQQHQQQQQSGSSSTGQLRKTKYPALLVQPKSSIMTGAWAPSDRKELDLKVKSLLTHTPAKLTEWLIQQGLVPAEQYDLNKNNRKSKLKLGMYSDSKKFPNSGGYVWIGDENRSKFVSVYRGSIFETTVHPPTVVLKLIYHWVCQTNLNNVITWVKVNHDTVDHFFNCLRSVCTTTVHEDVAYMGGSGKVVEIGVIALGTTTTDGNRREVRVEVLGVLDRATGNMRLRATEPIPGASQAERFAKIFEPLNIWIQRDSRLVADFSIDRDRLIRMGFNNVTQSSAQNKRTEQTNARITDYLKKVVPKMFQNSLSLLTTNMIQQFLDELTFRELFGNGPLVCFDSIVQSIANQTAATTVKHVSMSTRLKSVSENPFKDWRLSNKMPAATGIDLLPPSLRTPDSIALALPQRPNMASSPSGKRSSSSSSNAIEEELDIDKAIRKRMKLTSDLIDLESYFYATLQGDIAILASEFKADMAFKCHLCKKVYMNNIDFMKHLSLHVESERATAVDLVDLSQCKYCFKDFETQYAMQGHMEEIHLLVGSEFVCRICDEGFKLKTYLIHHMGKTHARSEMPYFCQVCGFRTSMHRDIVDHFQEAHDRTDKLQCPRCLKIYSLFTDKGYNSTVAASFVAHLQSHLDVKKMPCKKCSLMFHDEKHLKNHMERDHLSFKDFDGLEVYQYTASEDPIQMPKPDEKGMRTAPRKAFVKAPQVQASFAAQNLEDLVMYDVGREDCGECGRKMTMGSHYNAYLCCTKCRYSTCCSKAISVHVNLFHGPQRPVYNLGVPIKLDKFMHCVCGFKTESGNKMAKHLGMSGCKSAYPTEEEAKKAMRPVTSASFPRYQSGGPDDISSFDPNEVMAKAYMSKKSDGGGPKKNNGAENEGPLAFLGLQRKSVDEPEEEYDTSNEVPSKTKPRPPKVEDKSKSEPDNEDKKATESEVMEVDKATESEAVEDKAAESEAMGEEKATESEAVEDKATESEAVEGKATESEAINQEKATESEVVDQEKATESEAVEEEKASESEAVQEEKATEPEVIEEEKATEPEVIEEEKATEPEVIEEEKATESEVLEEEKASESEVLEDKATESEDKENELDSVENTTIAEALEASMDEAPVEDETLDDLDQNLDTPKAIIDTSEPENEPDQQFSTDIPVAAAAAAEKADDSEQVNNREDELSALTDSLAAAAAAAAAAESQQKSDQQQPMDVDDQT